MEQNNKHQGRNTRSVSRLTDNISSDLFEAASKMQNKGIVMVYVEGYEDIAFWRNILSRYEGKDRKFVITPPIRRDMAKGKRVVLNFAKQAGKYLLLCVDADFDYLFGDFTEQSRMVNNNPYIIHTYSYAIENLMCYPPSLYDICVKATKNSNIIFDFEKFMDEYSEIIYPLFLWYATAAKIDSQSMFTLSHFRNSVKINYLHLENNGEGTIKWVKRQVDKTLKSLEKNNPNRIKEVENFNNEIKLRGALPKHTYKYMQGHTLMDYVIKVILVEVCNKLQKDWITLIHQSSRQGVTLQNELSYYKNSLRDIDTLLLDNEGYQDSEEYEYICNDIETALKIKG